MLLHSKSLFCPFHLLTILLSLLSPSFVPLKLILEWQKSGTGMWSSCLALQSCKKVLMAWLLFCLFKNQTGEVPCWWILLRQSNQSIREAGEHPASQPNCTFLFHFKGFKIENTERTPNPAKIQEHQLCCLLAYRNTSLSLATDTFSRKENMFYSVVNFTSLGRPQLEICFLFTHFPWASASFKKQNEKLQANNKPVHENSQAYNKAVTEKMSCHKLNKLSPS